MSLFTLLSQDLPKFLKCLVLGLILTQWQKNALIVESRERVKQDYRVSQK